MMWKSSTVASACSRLVQVAMAPLLVLSGPQVRAQQPPSYTISTYAGGGSIPVPGLGTSTAVGGPYSVAADASGSVYFASSFSILRLDRKGVLTRVAGNGTAGFSGDGGPAVNAQIASELGIAVDASGNIYIGDSGRIRKISNSGIITTIAGTGVSGCTSQGAAASAAITNPAAIAVDQAGNVYFADPACSRVQRISTSGALSTVAGTGVSGFSGDGGSAIGAKLQSPYALTVDQNGNIYVADLDSERIRKISSSSGLIMTVAGSGKQGYAGDGSLATAALLSYPRGMAVDPGGNIYFADQGNNCVRKVSPTGIISTVAGVALDPRFPPQWGYSGDGVAANSSELYSPYGVALDGLGNLYIADTFNNRIRMVSAAGIISTVAGTGDDRYSGDGGPALNAQIDPEGLAVDAVGNLYFAERYNNRVRKISADGTITTIAGNGTAGYTGDGGKASGALLNSPYGVAVDQAGNVYVADHGNRRVRRISAAGIITTVAGGGTAVPGDGGLATNAQLYGPAGVAVDASGAIYIADAEANRIRRVVAGIMSTVAGNGNAGFDGDTGLAATATLNGPYAIALDGSGNLFIADTYNGRIRMVSSSGHITTVAGGGTAGDGGPATNASLGPPFGLTLDGAGNLFFTEGLRVREVSPQGIITTIAGKGTFGYTGDGGPALNAEFGFPWGIAVNGSANIFVADANKGVIRELQLQVVQSPSQIGLSAVVNAASNALGPVAPGEIVTLFGYGLGPAQLVTSPPGTSSFGTQLAGASISFDGIAAPLLYASASQVAAIVPFEVSGSSTQVTASYQGRKSVPLSIGVSASAPGLFTRDSTGSGQAAVVNQDGSINGTDHPAPPGSYISLFATGAGQTSPAGVDGALTAVPLPQLLQPVSISIGEVVVAPQYAGGAPNEVQGLIQINLQIPAAVAAGAPVPIAISSGAASSQPGVTIFTGH